jgi:hypothetical protein
MDPDKFNLIKKKWSKFSSWAVWAKAGEKPKSYIGDISIFDIDINPGILDILKPNIIMVGLNPSKRKNIIDDITERDWGNFHDPNQYSQDYKIRYAFERTDYEGAYMTDILKGHFETKAEKVNSDIKKDTQLLKTNISLFYEELVDIGATNPLIIVFGDAAYNYMIKENINKKYSRLIKIDHYSDHHKNKSKEEYRKNVLKTLEEAASSI